MEQKWGKIAPTESSTFWNFFEAGTVELGTFLAHLEQRWNKMEQLSICHSGRISSHLSWPRPQSRAQGASLTLHKLLDTRKLIICTFFNLLLWRSV